MKIRSFCCLMIILFHPCFAFAQEAGIGKIKTGTGAITAVRNHETRILTTGDQVYRNDAIRTGANSSVGILFEDNTMLSLGSRSEIILDEYVFAPEKGRMSMISRMIRGTASYISGIIGKQSPESVKFHTPDATIGIRGTHFLVKIADQ